MLKKICCGKSYNLDQGFCEVCGKKLESKDTCDGCGAEITRGLDCCEKCGAPIAPLVVNIPVEPKQANCPPSFTEKNSRHKNKIVGIVSCGIAALLIIMLIVVPMFKKPIVGRWNMSIDNNTYTNQVYVEFKRNGTYNINSLGYIEKGKYKLIKNGIQGKILIIPDDLKASSYKADYKIEGDILTLNNDKFKRTK